MEQPRPVPGVVHGSCVNQDLGYTSRWYLSVYSIYSVEWFTYLRPVRRDESREQTLTVQGMGLNLADITR